MRQQAGASDRRGFKRANGFLSALFEAGLVGVRALITSLWRRFHEQTGRQRTQSAGAVRDRPDKPPTRANTPEWDAVDEASWESFPASDPPTGWAGKDIKPPTLNGE